MKHQNQMGLKAHGQFAEERELFETWIRDMWNPDNTMTRDANGYKEREIQLAWMGWRAKAVRTERHPIAPKGDELGMEDLSGDWFDTVVRYCKNCDEEYQLGIRESEGIMKHQNQMGLKAIDPRINPSVAKYVKIKSYPQSSEYRVSLCVGVQSFNINYPDDSKEHAEWTADMLRIALSSMLEAERHPIAPKGDELGEREAFESSHGFMPGERDESYYKTAFTSFSKGWNLRVTTQESPEV